MRMKSGSLFLPAAILAGAAAALSGCSPAKPAGDKSLTAGGAALPVMENIALNARACWFRSNDADFRLYRLAPELKSYSGRPRILLVPHDAPNERPLLVVEASGNPAKINVYGPLMQTPLSNKIDKNLQEWSAGSHKC